MLVIGFRMVIEAEADEQYKSIISASRAAAPKWDLEQIIFAVGNCGSVVESDFYTKLKRLDVQEGRKERQTVGQSCDTGIMMQSA